MSYSPTPEENDLLDAIYKGQPFKPSAKVPINVPFLREHILEIASARGSGRAIAWEIHSATFAEKLDLRDGCRAGGGALPALEFVKCEFQAGFCADGAKLERLKFEGCRFTANESAAMVEDAEAKRERRDVSNLISLRNCRIATELWLEDLSPEDDTAKLGLLLVDAFAATVGTNVMLRDTTLRALQGESSATLPESRYALDLSTAKVGSDVRLMPRVKLEGGLKMRDARIGGTLWANGLSVTDGEDSSTRAVVTAKGYTLRQALRLDTTEIHGHVSLSLDGDELVSTFKQMQKRGSGQTDKQTAATAGERPDLQKLVKAFSFHSRGGISIRNATIKGDMYLHSANITGDLLLSGLELRGRIAAEEIPPSVLFQSQIADNVQVRVSVSGAIWLDNCRIGSDCSLLADASQISLTGGVLDGNASFKGDVPYFEASGITVDGDLTISCKKC